MSPQLYGFYLGYLAWINDGAPEHDVFTRHNGLCDNYRDYFRSLYRDRDASGDLSEMVQSFRNAGLNRLYPFNFGSPYAFSEECNKGYAHLNPQRIAWVRKKVADGS
jgi:hypothetical protein